MERESSNAAFEKQVSGMRETLSAAEEEGRRRKLWNGLHTYHCLQWGGLHTCDCLQWGG